MSGSIKESFERAFAEKNNTNDANEYVSDEDSGREQERQLERKRAKKRQRQTRSTNPKGRKSVTQWKTTTVCKKESVSSDKYPEILSTGKEFSTNTQQTELILAQTRYFDKDNADPMAQVGVYTHMRPVDYLFVRALIQRPPIKNFDILQKNDSDRMRSVVTTITRAYEESYLCEPVGSQRECLLGDECEGLNISHAKDRVFILREFLKPSEQKEYENTGKLPTKQNLCLMCRRLELMRAHTNIRADGMGVREDTILPDWCNIVNTEGEYRLEDCVISARGVWEGILDPIVAHSQSAYRLVEKNGIRHYEQWRMGYPQTDFRQPRHLSI